MARSSTVRFDKPSIGLSTSPSNTVALRPCNTLSAISINSWRLISAAQTSSSVWLASNLSRPLRSVIPLTAACFPIFFTNPLACLASNCSSRSRSLGGSLNVLRPRASNCSTLSDIVAKSPRANVVANCQHSIGTCGVFTKARPRPLNKGPRTAKSPPFHRLGSSRNVSRVACVLGARTPSSLATVPRRRLARFDDGTNAASAGA